MQLYDLDRFGTVEIDQLQLTVFLLMTAIMVLVLMYLSIRVRRKALRLRKELGDQRADALRSINYMLVQMDYDAEVLRLLRHARNTRSAGRTEEFNGALDTLMKKEREMMERVDRVSEFEGYLTNTYKERGILPGGRKGDAKDPTPEEIKGDIRTFIDALEKVRQGDLKLLEEKISFFEKWVESPQRQEIYKSLKAMTMFLEKGDPSGLEGLKKE